MTDEELDYIENLCDEYGVVMGRLDDIVDIIINDVEKAKNSERKTYESLKEMYLNNRYRSAGYSKRQIEDKMQRINGEVLGIERALSTLYQLKQRTEKVND